MGEDTEWSSTEDDLKWFDDFTEKFRYSEFCTGENREHMERVRRLIWMDIPIQDKWM